MRLRSTSWHGTMQVFLARSRPQPQTEDCLLSSHHEDTVSNRADRKSPHCSVKKKKEKLVCKFSCYLKQNVWRIMQSAIKRHMFCSHISVWIICSSRLRLARRDVTEHSHSQKIVTVQWYHAGKSCDLAAGLFGNLCSHDIFSTDDSQTAARVSGE